MRRKKKRGVKKTSSKEKKLARNLGKTLLQYIKGRRYRPSTFDELIDFLQIDPIHKSLFQSVLDDLVEAKKLKYSHQKYSPFTKAHLISGPISIHHKKGFGFVKYGNGPDVFIPKHATHDAVDGDIVEVEISTKVSPKGPEGVVIAILERSRSHLACTVTQKKEGRYLAFSPLLGIEKQILVIADEPLVEGDRIICLVKNWAAPNDAIEAVLERKLGHISDPSIDIIAAIEEFELPDGFSKEALEEAKSYGKIVSEEEVKKRRDLTSLECVTIDPDTAKDFDDAISLTVDEKGHFHLGVHIADVAHYVKPSMELDKEAFTRCNSTYFPGEVVPMLPKELSNELCSLKPKVLRLTQSVFAEFDKEGSLLHFEIERTVIKSAKRFTYKEALQVIEKKKKSKHAALLQRMVDLCHLLKRKRMDRGSIDFAMPDNVIIVNGKGEPQYMERVEYDITHQMIEEFMLKANEIVATHLNRQGKNLIYRIHEEPSEESFQDFYAFARSLGFKLGANPTNRDIQTLFAEAKNSPSFPQLSIAFIRSMRLAAYSPDNIGHYGLALEHYCHFTSPIRRYTDLIIQRLLFNELEGGEKLEAIAATCSEKERISFKAESSVVTLKKLRLAEKFFKEDSTRVYNAIISKIKPFALFFEVPILGLEGTFHVSEIGNDYYEYNPNTMSFKGKRSGKKFHSGNVIKVRLDQIDFVTRQTRWSLVLS